MIISWGNNNNNTNKTLEISKETDRLIFTLNNKDAMDWETYIQMETQFNDSFKESEANKVKVANMRFVAKIITELNKKVNIKIFKVRDLKGIRVVYHVNRNNDFKLNKIAIYVGTDSAVEDILTYWKRTMLNMSTDAYNTIYYTNEVIDSVTPIRVFGIENNSFIMTDFNYIIGTVVSDNTEQLEKINILSIASLPDYGASMFNKILTNKGDLK